MKTGKFNCFMVFCLLVAGGSTISAYAQSKCVITRSRLGVRVNATDPRATQQLQWYAEGVKAMQARSAANPNDPTGWTYQAAMHGTYTTPTKPLWNTCQHGNYFFLSWHRMYLYFFERIVRANSNPGFNLPYWDYDNPSSPTDPRLQLPPQFRNPKSSSNPLYVSERNKSMNDGGYLPIGDVGTDYSMQRIPFTCGSLNWNSSFGGRQVSAPVHFGAGFGALESLPHNAVHDDVGGWMGDPNTAAQDPIFWLHHSNIDRLWDGWKGLDSGRANTTDSLWLSQKFYFYDEKGTQCYLTAKDIENDLFQLDYTYQDTQVPKPPTSVNCPTKKFTATQQPLVVAEFAPQNKVSLSSKPLTHAVSLKQNLPKATPSQSKRLHRFVITFDNIDFDSNPGVGYEVYLNLPQGEKSSTASPYYIGTIHFFGLKHSQEENHEAQIQFEVSDVVAKLQKQNQWKDQINVTYVPVGPSEKPTEAHEVKVYGNAHIGNVRITQVD